MPDRDWLQIRVNGSPLEDALDVAIRDVEITLATNGPARARLVLADPLLQTLSTFSLTAALEIRLGDGHGQLRKLFSGEIIEVTLDEAHDQPCQVVVEGLDRSHHLGLATSVLSHQNQTPDDIIKQLCTEAGLQVKECPRLGSQLPYLLLASSAQQFLTEITTRHGHVWRYDMEAGGLRVEPISTEPTKSGLGLKFGETLYRLQIGQSARSVHSATVKGWDPSRSQTIVGTATAPSPRTDLVAGANDWTGQSNVLVSGQPILDQSEAESLARSVVTTAQRRSVTVRGQATLLPTLVPNSWITVGQATTPGERSFYVDRVVHRYTPGRANTVSTHFDGGNHPYASPLPALSSEGTFPLRADTLVVGVVTNNQDPENLGRVRLKFPWLSDADESNWARVASFGGGTGSSGARGSQFVPEPGDEVITGFENGDLRRPVVLGTLYNPKSKAPVWGQKSNRVTTRSITSHLGHILEFGDGDSPAEKFIRLSLAGEATELRLSEERVVLKTGAGREVEMTAGDTTIKFDKGGGILLKGTKIVIDGQTVEIKAQASLKVEAATAEVKGKGSVKVEGAAVEVNGKGMVKIAGGQVMIN